MKMKPQPKVYATRPPCKWHAYDCHRDVPEGDTLCAYHRPPARQSNRMGHYYDHGGKPPRTLGVAPDPGCDCTDCLRGL